jgi:hypothetical protein
MPEANAPTGASAAALSPDPSATIPRIKLGESGFTGLKVASNRIIEEQQRAFRYPDFINTVAEMSHNPTIGAATNVWRMMISRVKWDVQAPKGADETLVQRAAIVRTMMDDMEGQSWASFIEEVIPYLWYGFDVHEIVMRRRLFVNGSKYNDGLVGLKKLAPRAQDTIAGWVFSPDGSDLLGCQQSFQFLPGINQQIYQSRIDPTTGRIFIPREKFLLFSASSTKGNPEGNSIFKNIYLAYKQLSLLQDQELLGIAKDVQGILKIEIPPRYLDVNASDADKAVISSFQQIIDNYNAGTQRGLLVPQMYDQETKLPLFSYTLMESKGGAKYDTESVIRRLQGDILSALSVDILKLGAEGSGSFSLAESKSSVLALAIDYRLREIAQVLSQHLMRLIFQMNGWDCASLPEFIYKDVEEVSLEEFSKAIQRVFSTSAIEIDRPVLNRVREVLGIPLKGDDEPVDKEMLPASISGVASSAGKGMEVGTTGDGTSKTGTNGKERSGTNSERT